MSEQEIYRLRHSKPDLEKKWGLRLAVGILVRHQGEGHDWRQKRASDERHLLAAPG